MVLAEEEEPVITTGTGNKFWMSYDADKKKVKMEAAVFADQYFSVGFGKSMKQCDMIIFAATGAGKVYDTYSVAYDAPAVDANQDMTDLEVVQVQEGGKIKY